MSLFLSIHSRRQWTVLLGLALVVGVGVPALNLMVPEDSVLHVPTFMIQLLGKFICFAMAAVAIDMIWGFAGILSLGHGFFFALGGYAMGMYLMRSIGTQGVYQSELPDFMVFLDWQELPWYWYGFEHFPFALFMAMAVPGVFAFVFGMLAFRSRIRGVYFAIITQAMTYAMMLLFFRNDTGFGGNNGLTDFKRILGFSLLEDGTRVALYMLSALALLVTYLVARFIVRSKLGRVLTSIRDAESRVMFSGYNVTNYKVFVWTASAVICGLAGALYVPQAGIINPSEMEPANSIEMVIWVAVGGRGTLVGGILGAFAVNGVKSWLTSAMPEAWLYVLGAVFIAVVLFFPNGLIGLFSRHRGTPVAP